MTIIHFIVYSISSRKSILLEKEIKNIFSNKIKYQFFIKYSKYKGHAIELTKQSIKEGVDILVACGGDGTINEVARNIISTSKILGIIPIGSGNGLAGHLKIPKNISKALKILKIQNIKKIDVGKVNDDYFFSNMGVAFGAFFINSYHSYNQRGIIGYFRAFIASLFNFKYIKTKIFTNGLNQISEPFILLISNTNELGYNISLTPEASLYDRKLDIILVEKTGIMKIFIFLFMSLFHYYPRFKEVKKYKVENVNLYSYEKEFMYQIDGERVEKKINKLDISILEGRLNVVTPKN